MSTGDAIVQVLQSPNVSDSNGEPANVVDVLDDLASSVRRVSNVIYPPDTSPGRDASGGSVASLTEAVMGITAGLMAIAHAIDRLADATENK